MVSKGSAFDIEVGSEGSIQFLQEFLRLGVYSVRFRITEDSTPRIEVDVQLVHFDGTIHFRKFSDTSTSADVPLSYFDRRRTRPRVSD